MSEYMVGIDFGTTTSRVAIYRNGSVEVIENEEGDRVTPSWVTFTEDSIITGKESMEEYHRYPKTTVFEVRRLMGLRYNDPIVQDEIERLPYPVFNDLGAPKIKLDLDNHETKECYPEEITALILGKMKLIAELRFRKSITKAVIAVPTCFNDDQKQAMKDAAAIAGFNVVHLLSEPIAAALAFCQKYETLNKRNIMVYDFGRSTFNVSVLTGENGKWEVKSTNGDNQLGGTNVDMNLYSFLLNEFRNQYLDNCSNNIRDIKRLECACRQVKKKLCSTKYQTNIGLDCFSGVDHFCVTLTRSRFEMLNQELFKKTIQLADECLRESGFNKEDIHEVVLVGGSSRIPKIPQILEEYFGGGKINTSVNPEEAVVYGAAIHAANINQQQ